MKKNLKFLVLSIVCIFQFEGNLYAQYQKYLQIERTEKSAIIFTRDTSGFIEVDKNSVVEINETIIRFNDFVKLYSDSLKKLNFKIYNIHPEYVCFMDDSIMSFKHPIKEHLMVVGLSENPNYVGGIVILCGDRQICNNCANLDIYKFISDKLETHVKLNLYPR